MAGSSARHLFKKPAGSSPPPELLADQLVCEIIALLLFRMSAVKWNPNSSTSHPWANSSERTIPMSSGLAAVLEKHRHRSEQNSLGLVGLSEHAREAVRPGNLVQRVLQLTLEALGLPMAGWRAFRRTVATTPANCESQFAQRSKC